jgi:hypothetical protein
MSQNINNTLFYSAFGDYNNNIIENLEPQMEGTSIQEETTNSEKNQELCISELQNATREEQENYLANILGNLTDLQKEVAGMPQDLINLDKNGWKNKLKLESLDFYFNVVCSFPNQSNIGETTTSETTSENNYCDFSSEDIQNAPREEKENYLANTLANLTDSQKESLNSLNLPDKNEGEWKEILPNFEMSEIDHVFTQICPFVNQSNTVEETTNSDKNYCSLSVIQNATKEELMDVFANKLPNLTESQKGFVGMPPHLRNLDEEGWINFFNTEGVNKQALMGFGQQICEGLPSIFVNQSNTVETTTSETTSENNYCDFSSEDIQNAPREEKENYLANKFANLTDSQKEQIGIPQHLRNLDEVGWKGELQSGQYQDLNNLFSIICLLQSQSNTISQYTCENTSGMWSTSPLDFKLKFLSYKFSNMSNEEKEAIGMPEDVLNLTESEWNSKLLEFVQISSLEDVTDEQLAIANEVYQMFYNMTCPGNATVDGQNSSNQQEVYDYISENDSLKYNNDEKYKIVNEAGKKCSDYGYEELNYEECESAITQISNGSYAGVDEAPNQYPSGCYNYSDGSFYFNNHQGNPTQMDENGKHIICKFDTNNCPEEPDEITNIDKDCDLEYPYRTKYKIEGKYDYCFKQKNCAESLTCGTHIGVDCTENKYLPDPDLHIEEPVYAFIESPEGQRSTAEYQTNQDIYLPIIEGKCSDYNELQNIETIEECTEAANLIKKGGFNGQAGDDGVGPNSFPSGCYAYSENDYWLNQFNGNDNSQTDGRTKMGSDGKEIICKVKNEHKYKNLCDKILPNKNIEQCINDPKFEEIKECADNCLLDGMNSITYDNNKINLNIDPIKISQGKCGSSISNPGINKTQCFKTLTNLNLDVACDLYCNELHLKGWEKCNNICNNKKEEDPDNVRMQEHPGPPEGGSFHEKAFEWWFKKPNYCNAACNSKFLCNTSPVCPDLSKWEDCEKDCNKSEDIKSFFSKVRDFTEEQNKANICNVINENLGNEMNLNNKECIKSLDRIRDKCQFQILPNNKIKLYNHGTCSLTDLGVLSIADPTVMCKAMSFKMLDEEKYDTETQSEILNICNNCVNEYGDFNNDSLQCTINKSNEFLNQEQMKHLNNYMSSFDNIVGIDN